MSNIDSNRSRSEPSKLGKWISYLGPGFITAALVFGPGSLTITSKLGAIYGYQFLWVIILSTFFMVVFTTMGIRIGLATDCSLLTTIRNRWGKSASLIIGVGVFPVSASFQAGNSIGTGMPFAELLHTSSYHGLFSLP